MNKIKINLNKEFKDLEGKVIPDIKMSKTLSNVLSALTEGDEIKFHFWSLELFAKGEIEIDQADFNTLRTTIKTSKLPTLLKAPLILELDAAKSEAEKA